MELQRRFFTPPSQSFFLFGPRGTGKSTWLRHVFPEAAIVDLLDPQTSRKLSAKPERLRDIVAGTPPRSTLIIDEVQRVPGLVNGVQSVLEAEDRLQFALTGS